MTTIPQLPAVASVGANDLLPLSQSGLLYSAKVSQITAGLQPLINVPTGDLLGRQSTGTGAPESLSVGTGLVLSGSTLSADGADHALYPLQAAMAVSDDVVISHNGAPALLPVAALRGLFAAGSGVSIDSTGIITFTAAGAAGPAGPAGPAGATGPAGPQGLNGAAGPGLAAPNAASSASSIAGSDYVAIWQNGGNMWMPYSQFIGGQTINQLPAAGPAADSDSLLVAQGSVSLSVQSFSAIWTYLQAKLTSVKAGIVELTANTVLDGSAHNNRILIASAPLTLTANFSNMGSGFTCSLINLSPGLVTFGTGITSGSGATTLPPGASTALTGFSYSGGSQIWWNGIVANTPVITVAAITAPAPGASFTVTGGVFNDTPAVLDYSTDGGITWLTAPSPVIAANGYSFVASGLAAGTYQMRVRDHADFAVTGTSNSFTILAPSLSINTVPATATAGIAIAITGTVSPAVDTVNFQLSSQNTISPANGWIAASNSNGALSVSLTPASAGTYYVWAQDPLTGETTVSSAINVAAAAPVTYGINNPGGSYTHGLGVIPLNGSVTPNQDIATQVALSTSNLTAPSTGWQAASIINANTLWALYFTTPAAAGDYYVWVETTTGAAQTVSGFTIPVS